MYSFARTWLIKFESSLESKDILLVAGAFNFFCFREIIVDGV